MKMFNEKDILARLQKGDDAQTIAEEFAILINKVNKEYQEQKAAKEAEARIQEMKEKELQHIFDDCREWCRKYYDTDNHLAEELFGALSVKDFIAELDSIKKWTDKGAVKVFKGSADDVITDFLKMMKW